MTKVISTAQPPQIIEICNGSIDCMTFTMTKDCKVSFMGIMTDVKKMDRLSSKNGIAYLNDAPISDSLIS